MAGNRRPGPQNPSADPQNIRDGTNSLQPSPQPSSSGLWHNVESSAESVYSAWSNRLLTLAHQGLSALDLQRALYVKYGDDASATAEDYFGHIVDQIKNAADWESLNKIAGPIVGQQSFQAGAALGFGESLFGDVGGLLGLLKLLVLAAIYERTQTPATLVTDPMSAVMIIAAKCIPSFAAQTKAADDQLKQMLKELFEVAKHPLDFIEAVGKNAWKGGMDDLNELKYQITQNTVLSQFQAGRIAGRVLYQVIMAIMMVVGAVGTVAKIASKFPELVRVAEILSRGGKLEELTGIADLEKGGGAVKAVEEGPEFQKVSDFGKAQGATPEREPAPETPPENTPPPPGPAKLDPSMVKYARPSEQLTAQRLADTNPEFNGRTFKTPPPPDPGYDWSDDLGRTYDAMGDGKAAKYLNIDDFKDSIDHHLLKGNTFTVIDTTGFAPDQVAAVRDYVNSLSPAQKAMIRRIGF